MTTTDQLFTGQDILAAENYLRCAKTLADAVKAVRDEMPEAVVVRLAKHVGADASNPLHIAMRARTRSFAATR
jgi:hypothetical protein